jgi:predicted phage-related endonuclease
MATEIIPITSREQWLAARRKDVTASVAGSLLDVHDYTTAFEVWARKTGRITEEQEDNPALRRGRLLEPVAIQMIAEDNPTWKVTAPGVYLRDPELRMGATPDLYVDCPEKGPGLIQIKTTADLIYKQKWRDPDTREIVVPLWIVCQTLIELELSGRSWAAVALMVVGMGLDLHIIQIPRHAGVMKRIKDEIAKFWAIVDSGEPMQPDYARDGDALAKVYSRGDEPDIDLTGDEEFAAWIVRRDSLKARIDEATGDLNTVKNQVKGRLGNAAIARCGSRTVTWKVVNKREYIVPASSNRTLLFK